MLFPLLAMSLTACDKGNTDPDPAPVEKVVDSLSVKTQPTKTTYNAGESFDGSGMVLTVNYVGGTSEDITSGWTVNPAGALNASDNKVTVSYGGKSVDVTITVNGDTPIPATGMKAAYEAAEKLTSGETEPFEFGGVVVGKRAQTNEYFIQDGAYGIDIFQPSEADAPKLVLGKKVKVTSTLQNFNGLIETKTISSIAEDGDGTMPQPAAITSGAELDALKTNVLVNASVVVPQAPAYDTSKDLKLTVVLGSDETTLFIKKADVATHEQFIKSLTEGCTINVTNAVVGCYKTKQIVVLDDTQLEKGSGPVQPVLSLDKTTATIEVEGTVTVNATVLNTEDPVVWTIDNENVGRLSASGKVATVTGLAKGTVTLKAAVAGLEKTCVITVNEKGQGTNYGTEDNPISISEAVAILEAECVNSGDYTKQAITAIGEVKTIRNTYIYDSVPCFEMDLTDGSKDVYLYRCHATAELAEKVMVGSTVKFVGSAKNHNGILEFVDSNSGQCHVLSATATTEPTLTLKETETVKVGADVVLTATVLNTENAVEWSLLGDSGSYASITPNGNSVTVRGIAKGLAKVKAAIPADNLEAVCEVTVEEDVHGDVDVDYSFSALEKKDSPAMTNDEAKAAFVNGLTSGTDIVSSVTVSNTYAGEASIRVGSKNGGGSLVIATTEKVTKVVVTAHGYSSTELNKISIGTEEVTVKADADKYVFEVTAAQSITINADKRVLIDGIGFVTEAKREIEKIEIVGTLAKDTYFVGDTFDPTGLSLKVTYKEGDPETLTSGFTFTVDTLTEEGTIAVYAEYKGERSENNVQITVNKVELVSIEVVVAETYDKKYVVGENWATEGLSVQGHFNNGDEHTLNAEDYDLSFDPIAPAVGVTKVTVTATLKDGSVDPATKTIEGIEVTSEAQPELSGIVIKTNPTTMTYDEGQSFDPTGLVITASYTLGKDPADIAWGAEGLSYDVADPLTTSSTTVTITYEEDGVPKTTTLTIIVNAVHINTVKQAYEIAEKLGKDEYSDELTFEGVVTATQGSSFVVADGDYAILVYNKPVTDIAVGKTVSIKSTMQNYGGLIETKTISSATLTGTGTVPEAVEVTAVSQLNDLKTNILVNCAQIEVISKESTWASNANSNWKVKIAGVETTLSLNKFTFDSEKSALLKSLDVGDKFTANNLIVGSYNGTRQLSSTGESTFSKFVPEITGLTIGGDFTKKSYAKGANWDVSGLTFTGTTADGDVSLTANDLDFEFSPATATDSSVKSVTVTAKYKANTEISAQITITGITVSDAEEKEYTITYTSKADPEGLTSSPNAIGFDTSRAAQWSNNEGLTLTTGSYSGVTKIVLTTSTNSANDAYEISCTVGGNEFGETISLQNGNNQALVFEDDAASGVIVITYTLKGTKKSIYVKSLVITAQ